MRTLILTWTVILLPVCCVTAGDAGRESPFSIGAGARSVALGGSLTSLAVDGSSVFYNPAGLGYLEFQEVDFMQSLMFEGSRYNFGSYVYPMSSSSGLGIGFMRLGTGDIVRRREYVHAGTFSYSTSQLVVSYGRQLRQLFGFGASLKVVNQSLDDITAYGVGVDVGVRSMIRRHVNLGAIVRDLVQPELRLAGRAEETPRSLVVGASLNDLAICTDLRLTASLDIEHTDDKEVGLRVGSEIVHKNTLALRLGYGRDNPVVGAGFSRNRLRIDYAYELVDHVGDLHHISLSLRFGKSVAQREAELREQVTRLPFRPREEAGLNRLREKANRFFHQFELDSALVYFRLVQRLDPNDQEAAISIEAIEMADRVQKDQADRLEIAADDQQKFVRSFYARAQLYLAQRNYTAALDFLDLIIEIDPGHPFARELRKIVEREKAVEISFTLDTARVAESEGRAVRAIEALNRVIELDPTNREAVESRERIIGSLDIPQRLALGIDLFERGAYRAARRQFNQVLSIRPQEAVALDYLRRIDEAESQVPPGGSTLEDLQKNPRIWKHYTDGLRFMRDGQYQQAIDEWEKVLEVFPDNQSTLDNIEQARLRLESE
ncbi:MAG: PorV/PorQ family protein [Candidatus Zixiibacteriota bacterium]|nr:MAG: PorV/PorQ family protein [candidate division Zixibacteria bacterium]